jgi:hypothetical protein
LLDFSWYQHYENARAPAEMQRHPRNAQVMHIMK